jgi:acylphosphatase
MTVRLTVLVSGDVQGVGFRYWVRRWAEPLGLNGWASNLSDGRVEVVAEGPRTAGEQLLAALSGDGPPGSVADVRATWSAAEGLPVGFRVR